MEFNTAFKADVFLKYSKFCNRSNYRILYYNKV